MSNYAKITKIFKNYFDKVVVSLKINRNLECVRESLMEDSVLTLTEKYATYPAIKIIKSGENGINANFFFNFVDQVKSLTKLKS